MLPKYPVKGGDNANNIGYLSIPQNSQSGSYTLQLSDSGKHIYETGASKVVTVPANSAVAFPIGTAITVVNSNATDMTTVITTDTLEYVNVGAVTTITIPQYNMITLLKVAATTWLASGTAGVTTA